MYTLQEQNVIVPEKKKYVLNAHIGYINSLQMYSPETRKIINRTLDIIEQHLCPVFGKYALYNLIIHDHHIGKFTTNVFTHDGINSLLNLEFMSPIQKYLANNIVYIGQHVDRVAHDGTTTAMLFATLLFRELYNKLAEYYEQDVGNNPKDPEKLEKFKTTVLNITSVLQETMDKLIVYTKELTITKPDKNQLQKLLFITTKGNKKLSAYISDIFANVPLDALEIFKYGRSHIETDEDFKLVETEEDYWIMQNGFPSELFNDALGTTFEGKGVYVLVYPVMYEGCPDYHRDVIDYIFSKFPLLDPNNLLLFIPLSINITTAQKNIRFNYPHVVTAKYSTTDPNLVDNPLELKILLALADTENLFESIKSSADAEEFKNQCNEDLSNLNRFLFKCDIKVTKYGIKFYNLYETTDKYIHKFYYDKTKTRYHQLLNALKSKMTELEKQFNVQDAKSQYKTYQLLYRNMIAYKLPFIQVGGKTQEVLSRMDLIEDAKGAATAALRKGVIKNPHFVFATLGFYLKQQAKTKSLEHIQVTQVISDIFNTLLTINLLMETDATISQEHIQQNIIPYLKDQANWAFSEALIKDRLKTISPKEKLPDAMTTYHLSVLYTELFSRVKEVIPKLLSTYNIIVPDTVVIHNNDPKGGN